MKQKRIAAIHDISGIGKCSLTVCLPVLSAAGFETAVMPTAVLSTHTGGFKDYTYRDLTDDILPMAKHWKSNGFHFDAIYTGFLGSYKQVELVCEIIDLIRSEDTLILVDPVMADSGVLYKTFGDDFPQQMKKLTAKADIITPNITEACLMTDTPYREGPYDNQYIETLLGRLSDVCGGKIVLTGVYFDEDKLGSASYDRGKIEYVMIDKIEGFYHGTGDVFCSALLAGIESGKSLTESMKIAADFVSGSIHRTMEDSEPRKYGVNFETELPKLIRALGIEI